MRSKERNVVRKGIENFDVLVVDPTEYEQSIYMIYVESMQSYGKNAIPLDSFHKYLENIKEGPFYFFIAIYKNTNEIAGYATSKCLNDYCELTSQKAKKEYERFQVNAALVYAVLQHYNTQLKDENGFYILDGARSIYHSTHFQDYLEKYFGFRKAYCKLCICYAPWFGRIIRILYPFRKIFKKFDRISSVHAINAVLFMEEISRKQYHLSEAKV